MCCAIRYELASVKIAHVCMCECEYEHFGCAFTLRPVALRCSCGRSLMPVYARGTRQCMLAELFLWLKFLNACKLHGSTSFIKIFDWLLGASIPNKLHRVKGKPGRSHSLDNAIYPDVLRRDILVFVSLYSTIEIGSTTLFFSENWRSGPHQ